jgi:hypothetical protein
LSNCLLSTTVKLFAPSKDITMFGRLLCRHQTCLVGRFPCLLLAAPSSSSVWFPSHLPSRGVHMEKQSSTLGNYTIGKTIHAGLMWKVKLARNNLTGEEVAINIIKRGMGLLEEKGACSTCSSCSSKKHLVSCSFHISVSLLNR